MHELEQAWKGLDERLEHQGQQLHQVQRRHAIDSVRSRLRLVSLGQVAELAVGVLLVLWAGGYWFDHLGQTHLVVYGLAIHLYGLGLVIVAALQLTRLWRLDHREPVLELQRRLVAIRRLRVNSERVLLVCGFVLWVPLLFVGLNAIGVDVWRHRPAIVLANLGVGVVLAVAVDWLISRFRTGFERDAAGRSLREAEAELTERAQP
jgi:hypothetical protein